MTCCHVINEKEIHGPPFHYVPGTSPASARARKQSDRSVLRAADASAYERVIDVLVSSGIRSIELTLTTPGTLEALPHLLHRTGTEIGFGTVACVAEAEQALDAGAGFLVTPSPRHQR